MTPDDKSLWKQVVASVVPLGFRSGAASIWAPSLREIAPPTVIDLHGMTLNIAHSETLRFIRDAHARRMKSVTVITGLSGPIRKEFPLWLENLPQVRKLNVLNGGGAFKVLLTKVKG